MKELTVEIITPQGAKFKKKCTSVHFNVADNLNENYSGSYGVRAGHANAIFALKKGIVMVFDGDSLILKCECGDGFATVNKNLTSLVVESFIEQ